MRGFFLLSWCSLLKKKILIRVAYGPCAVVLLALVLVMLPPVGRVLVGLQLVPVWLYLQVDAWVCPLSGVTFERASVGEEAVSADYRC